MSTTISNINFINLTPHIIMYDDGINNFSFAPEEGVIIPRVSAFYDRVEALGGILNTEVSAGHRVVNLPEPRENTFYIVSTLVRTACPNRVDLISPTTNTENQVREGGLIISVSAFERNV